MDNGTGSKKAHITDSRSLSEGLAKAGVGIWRWNADSDELFWTPNLENICSLPKASDSPGLSAFLRQIHPHDVDYVAQAIAAARESGIGLDVTFRTAPGDGRPQRWVQAFGGAITATDGTTCLTGACIDVTERIHDDDELVRRLQQQQSIGMFGSYALGETDLQKILDRAAQTASETFNVPFVKILKLSDDADHLVLNAGTGWKEGLTGSARIGVGNMSQAGLALQKNEPVIVYDLPNDKRFTGPKFLLEHGVRSGMSVVIPGLESRPFGVFGVHTNKLRRFDIHDVNYLVSLANIIASTVRNHMADTQKSLLIREMSHRAGNMLQLVSAIANQTFRDNNDIVAARHAFSERLSSLSRANHLVASGGWTSARFRALLEEILAPFSNRIQFNGNDIVLPSDFCFDFALIAHELSTNSAKYGSLAAIGGKISIRWDLKSQADGTSKFSFTWTDPTTSYETSEAGHGFGSRLTRTLVEQKWKGAMTMSMDDGYRFSCEITLPARA